MRLKSSSHNMLKDEIIDNLSKTSNYEPRKSERFALSQRLKSSLNSVVSQTVPCKVVLQRLSPQFIEDAIAGRVKWKRFSCKYFDVENYLRNCRINLKEEKTKKARSKRRHDCTKNERFVVSQDSKNINRERKKRRYTEMSADCILKCEECSFSTNNTDNLLLHTGIHKYNCKLCNLKFEKKSKYQSHNYEMHRPVVNLQKTILYGCKSCQLYFNAELSIKIHLNSHITETEDRRFACTLCKAVFTRDSSMVSHLTSKHLYYKCTFCNYLALNLDTIERHSQNIHLFFGKPFECNVCDFRSFSFGGLTLHRRSHGIEWQNGSEYCAICLSSLLSDRMSIVEHLAGHTTCCLFECLSCDFRTSSFDLIHNHGAEYHATYDIRNFAKMIDVDEILKKIKFLLNYSSNGANKIRKRTKPTLTETKNAIAGIYNETYHNFDTQNMDELFDDCKNNFSAINTHSFNITYDYYLMAPPTVVLNSAETHFSFEVDNDEDTESIKDKEKEIMTKNLAFSHSYDEDCGNSQVFDCPTPDPISIAIASTLSPPVFEATEGVLTVDPITGQLFLEDLSLVDEKGNNIHIAVQDLASLME